MIANNCHFDILQMVAFKQEITLIDFTQALLYIYHYHNIIHFNMHSSLPQMVLEPPSLL